MTCQEFAVIRRDYVRQQWLSEGSRLEAKRHVAECVACRESVDRERTLTAALGEVASQREMTGAPVHVEASVMAAFAAKHPPRRSMMWRAAAWAIPLAAGLLLFAVLRSGEREQPLVARETPVPEPIPAPRAVMEESEPAPVAAVTAPRRARRPVARSTEYVTEFVPLRYGKPLESGEPVVVVRMELPGSQLRRLGLPVAPDAASGTVKADVLLGGDGLAKAIRFVY